MTTLEKLQKVQSELKAPKGQFNKFGNYKYRSCEDILEAVKPLLKENKLTLVIYDGMVEVGDRIYVKATAELSGGAGEDLVTSTAFAREPESKKGMDASQITGTASSYARKYALNGLFLIDDTKDADTNERHMQADHEREEFERHCDEQRKKKPTDAELSVCKGLLEKTNSDVPAFLNWIGVKTVEDMNYEQYAKACVKLNQKLEMQNDKSTITEEA